MTLAYQAPTRGQVFSYGLPGLALSFAAVPLYILTPQLYAGDLGLSLGLVGVLLMLTRLVDAFVDPWVGRQLDRTQGQRYQRWMLPSMVVLAVGFVALVLPPENLMGPSGLLAWLVITTLLVSLGNSAAGLAHQTWAISWTPDVSDQSRLVASREVLSLVGTVLASGLLGMSSQLPLAGVLLALTVVALIAVAMLGRQRLAGGCVLPDRGMPLDRRRLSAVLNPTLRRLLTALTLNAIANAIPATLFLLFVADGLGLERSWAAGLLGLYFLAAAVSMPFWTRIIPRVGPRRAWMGAISLAIASFVWAVFLPPGAGLAFGVICLISGIALGAELTCPSLLLGQQLERDGGRGRDEGAVFGVWGLLAKLALAAAAGIVLPGVEWLGYQPGQAASGAASVLHIAYAGLPSLLKLAALFAVWRLIPELHVPPVVAPLPPHLGA